MKKVLYFVSLLIIFTIVLTGCTSNKASLSDEQLQKLSTQASITDIEKSEFNTKDLILNLYTKDEYITKEEFDKALSNLSLVDVNGNKLEGIATISSNKFSNTNFSVKIISENNNYVITDIDKKQETKYSLETKKYSKEMAKDKISSFSKDIISYNELVGKIEIELSKGNQVDNQKSSLNSLVKKITDASVFLSSLSEENSQFSNIEELRSKLTRISLFLDLTNKAVDSAVSSKAANPITNSFLNINELDKLARDIVKL